MLRKNLILLIFLFLISFPSVCQNLVRNPGFESNLSGWSYWSKEGSGGISVTTDTVYSGAKSLKIKYPGEKDWAVQTGKIPVEPGSQYQLSCRAMPVSVAVEANCSLVLFDADQNVLDWAFGRATMDKNLSTFKLYQNRFVIPEGVKFVQPRLEGWGSCELFVDDISLEKVVDLGVTGNYTVENENIRAELHLPSLSVDLTNKSNMRVYRSLATQFAKVDSVDVSVPGKIRLFGQMMQGTKPPVTIEFRLEGKALEIRILGDDEMALSSDIKFPGIIASQAGEYFIVPRGTGTMFPVGEASPFGDFAAYSWKSTMPFVGVTNLKDGYMVVTDDQWDALFRFEKPVGQNYYSFQLNQKPAKSKLGYDRTCYIVLVEDGYEEMCTWYRNHAENLGYVKTFSVKGQANENIDKLIGAVDFWPLNMNLNVTFLRNVKLMGMDKATWNLTGGWGFRNFSVLIDSINSMGFLSNRYDIFTDVWPENSWGYRSEGYPNDVIVDAGGNLKKGWLAYHDGQPFQGYYTCSATHKAYAQSYVQNDLSVNNYNSRFIDVELSSSLEECFSEVHPVTRKQDAESRKELLGYIKNDLNLVTGVEEAHDFAFPNADYGEGTMTIIPAANAGYDWAQPLDPTDKSYQTRNISPQMRIPLHGLVYHDVHIPTWYTGDGVSKVPAFWEDKDLWNILYGTMPLFMPPSLTYWNTNLEKFMTSYHLISAVTRNVGYSKMVSHDFLSSDRNIQKTSFDNGWQVVANFDSVAHAWNDKILAAKGFYANSSAGDEVFRIVENGQVMGGALSGDRLFFNPYGNELTWKGVRTSQSVFVQKYTDFLLVSFIGKQNYIDLSISELPFDLKEIAKVTEYFTGQSVRLTETSDGWSRLNRPSGKSFFKVFYKAKTTGLQNMPENKALKIYPNPASGQLTVMQDKNGAYLLSVSSPDGCEIFRKSYSGKEANLDISFLTSGMYILTMIQDGARLVSKFIKR